MGDDKNEWQNIDKAIIEASAACDAACVEDIAALEKLVEQTRAAHEAFAECRKAWLVGTGAPLPVLSRYWQRTEAVREAEALVAETAAAVNEADRYLQTLLQAKYAPDLGGAGVTTSMEITYMPKAEK
jgi:predicted trehalose synthase